MRHTPDARGLRHTWDARAARVPRAILNARLHAHAFAAAFARTLAAALNRTLAVASARAPAVAFARAAVVAFAAAFCVFAAGPGTLAQPREENRPREPRKFFRVEEYEGTEFIDREGRVVLRSGQVDFSLMKERGKFAPLTARAEHDDSIRSFSRRIRVGDFSEGLARFSWDLRPGSRALHLAYGFIDETGKVVIAPLFRSVEEFREGRAMFRGERGRRGYIDRAGRVAVPARYAYTWNFSEGLAAACVENHKCGYIDRDGNEVVPFRYWAATHFSEGLALVGLDGEKTAYIDKAGRTAFVLRETEYGGEFREGLATVRVGVAGKYGYMDRAGRVRIPAQYDDARPFSEGLALVSKDGDYGFIDRAGRVVVPLKYAYASSFSEGLAAVTTARGRFDAGWGYIDREGRVRIPLGFDYAAPFSGGLAAIDRNNDGRVVTDAYINARGRVVWEKRPRE